MSQRLGLHPHEAQSDAWKMIIRTARRLPSAVGPSWPVSAAHSLVGPSTATRRTGATQPNPSPRTQRRSYAISKLQTKLPDEIIERLEAVKWVEGEQDPDRKIQSEQPSFARRRTSGKYNLLTL